MSTKRIIALITRFARRLRLQLRPPSKNQFLAWLSVGLVATVLVGAFALRLARANYGLPYPIWWDEPLVMNSALHIMGTGDWKPLTFNYGSFVIYLAVITSSLAYLRDAAAGLSTSLPTYTEFAFLRTTAAITNAPNAFLFTRALWAVLGTAGVGLAYLGGRWLKSRPAGLFAAGLLALAPMHILLSSVAVVDGVAALLAWGATLAAMQIATDHPDHRWYWVAGILTGLATASKVNLALVLIVIPLGHGLRARHLRQSRRLWQALGLVPISFLAVEPFALLSYSDFLASLGAEAFHYSVAGHADAVVERGWPMLLRYLREIPNQLGVLGAGLAVIGGVAALVTRPRATIVMVSFPLVYVLFMSRQIVYFARNATPIFWVAAVCAGVGLIVVWAGMQWLAHRVLALRASRWVMPLTIGGTATLAFFCIWPSAVREARTSLEIYRSVDTRERAAAWLAANAPVGSLVGISDQLPIYLPSFTSKQLNVQTVSGSCQTTEEAFDYVLLNSEGAFPTEALVQEFFGQTTAPDPYGRPLFNPRILIYQPTASSQDSGAIVRLVANCWIPLAPTQADGQNAPQFTPEAIVTAGYANMAYGGWAEYQTIEAPEGWLHLQLRGFGSFGGGRFPYLEVALQAKADGTEISRQTIELTGEMADYPLVFPITTPGQYAPILYFNDDHYAPDDGDRNAFVASVNATWSETESGP